MTLWAQAHPEYVWVRRRTTPDTDVDDRVAALDRVLAADPEPAVLVATSLGCLTVARWAATHTGPVAAALLTVPPDVPFPPARLPFRAMVVGSRDDEHMPYARAEELAATLGAEFVDAGAVGHLNTASGHGPWPLGERLLAQLLAEAGADPHVHVDVKLRSDVAVREVLASTFGLVADSPTTVTTGCDLRVPLARTSVHPESVTCLPCREFAHGQHLRLAEQVESFSRMPGAVLTPDQATAVASRHRDLARRFAPGSRR